MKTAWYLGHCEDEVADRVVLIGDPDRIDVGVERRFQAAREIASTHGGGIGAIMFRADVSVRIEDRGQPNFGERCSEGCGRSQSRCSIERRWLTMSMWIRPRRCSRRKRKAA